MENEIVFVAIAGVCLNFLCIAIFAWLEEKALVQRIIFLENLVEMHKKDSIYWNVEVEKMKGFLMRYMGSSGGASALKKLKADDLPN